MKNLFIFLACQLCVVFSANAKCTLPKPTNFIGTAISSCTISLSWSAVPGAASYSLRYKKSTSTAWTIVNTGIATSYDVTALDANTKYSLGVASVCTDGKVGTYTTTLKIKTLTCTSPLSISISNVTTNSATAHWQSACTASQYYLRYRLTSAVSWTVISGINSTSYVISGLQNEKDYEVQVRSTCNIDTSQWTPSSYFFTGNPSHTNIVMIMLDDARYDAFKPNGGPSFLNFPAVDRIANEGVNFKYMIPTTSLCTPSRGTALTGKYAHKHGAYDNGDTLNSALPLIQKILQDNGYYTGIIGKYSFTENPPGCNWFAVKSTIDYIDPDFYVNGTHVTYTGNVSDAYTDLIQQFFKSVPAGKKFMLFFWPITPHGPSVPRDADKNLYNSNTMPLPTNFFKYPHNYPSYYYDENHIWSYTATQTDSMRRIEFQAQQGSNMNVDTITSHLQKLNLLDSTLLIFTSDNGYIKGEHLMQAKEVALEESIRLPLFIRFPKWFAANSLVANEIASNMDLAPTILEAAGITNIYDMDGISLHSLYTGALHRKDLMYELCTRAGFTVPALRGVRSLNYMYIKTYCTDTTEEIYNLSSDAKEDTNKVFNVAYASALDLYRFKLDSLRTKFNDVIPLVRDCSLSNIQYKKPEPNPDQQLFEATIFPNPAENYFTMHFNHYAQKTVDVFDMMGSLMFSYSGTGDEEISVDCKHWMEGSYLVKVSSDKEIIYSKLIVVR